MSVITAVEGQTCTLKENFVDDFNDPLELSNTQMGPMVRVFDDQNDLIVEHFGVPDINGQPGDWSADISFPDIGLTEKKEFTAVWSFSTSKGQTHRSKQALFVEPSAEGRDSDIIVVSGRDRIIQMVLPFVFRKGVEPVEGDVATQTPARPGTEGDRLRFSLFRNNVAMFGEDGLLSSDPSVHISTQLNKTVASIPAVVGTPKLEPALLMVDHYRGTEFVPTTYTYKVWPITPQVLVAASQLDDFINKARIQNVVPELDYTQTDLIQYLARGLALFNAFPPHTSAFNGNNMQGIILDAWLNCSAYYALASQLQAEGAMAFDFSGQSVSLNVDRTPAIEGALGRVESALDQNVKPLKKLLAKAGVLSGDGSDGGRMIDGSSHIGTLGILNAPTTRLPMAGHRGSWFRPFY